MKIKGKQLVDNTLNQQQMNITTDSILSIYDITNKEYVDSKVTEKINNIKYSSLNLDMSANNATVGEKACDVAVIEFPLSNLLVKINGVDVNVGENQDCYFSPNGVEIRPNGEAQKGDYLYWNSSSFDLEDDDEIDFRYLTGYDAVVLEENTTVELDPVYDSTVVRYTGGDGTTMNVIIEDATFVVGNIGGQFVWDIGGADEHTFTSDGESIIQVVNNNNYTIWYDGEGSLIYSIKGGNYIQDEIIIIKSLTSHGKAEYGQMGDESVRVEYDYTQIFTLPYKVEKVFGMSEHSAIKTIDGKIYMVGLNSHGQLFTSQNYGGYLSELYELPYTDIKKVLVTALITIILFEDGTIKCAGDNTYGQLGMGDTNDYKGVIQTPNFTNIKDVYSKGTHVFFII